MTTTTTTTTTAFRLSSHSSGSSSSSASLEDIGATSSSSSYGSGSDDENNAGDKGEFFLSISCRRLDKLMKVKTPREHEVIPSHMLLQRWMGTIDFDKPQTPRDFGGYSIDEDLISLGSARGERQEPERAKGSRRKAKKERKEKNYEHNKSSEHEHALTSKGEIDDSDRFVVGGSSKSARTTMSPPPGPPPKRKGAPQSMPATDDVVSKGVTKYIDNNVLTNVNDTVRDMSPRSDGKRDSDSREDERRVIRPHDHGGVQVYV